MNLTSLERPYASRKRRKIVGRGESSGHGKTSTRGSNGQRSRSGRGPILGFEGGQNPLIRSVPKRGFRSRTRRTFQIVNIKNLTKLKSDVSITPELLEEKGLIKDRLKPIKILGEGALNNPLMIRAHAFSKSARLLVEKAGGKAECLKV